MVRDDFWMAAIRFMRELEVRLLDGQNSAAVDLFPIRHAEKVLAAFGRAFGVLPDASTELSKDQKQFLAQAVSGFAQEGKVICVRLALFAEMMKGKTWTPATLKEVGGTEGVGVTFLEETFSTATAPPEHRYHQKAARGVLKALLPDSGTDLKGHMRSYAALLEASGYENRPSEFDDLIRILDSEIRLITPTDPEGKAGADESASQIQSGQKYYQLTHDYLVRSLRDWLTRKQRETRRGRAELRLAERAALWQAKPENRHLPSWWEYLTAVWLVPAKNRTPLQQTMLRKAGRVHAVRWGSAMAVLLLIGYWIGNVVEADRHAAAWTGGWSRLWTQCRTTTADGRFRLPARDSMELVASSIGRRGAPGRGTQMPNHNTSWGWRMRWRVTARSMSRFSSRRSSVCSRPWKSTTWSWR